MGKLQRTVRFSENNLKISLAVRSKFFFLLLLTLALMFDTVSHQFNLELSEVKDLPETLAEK